MSGTIIALANQKGGVGKTTTAVNLATAIAAVGKKVLMIDLDPQGNATTGFGIEQKDRQLTTYDVIIGGVSLMEAAMETDIPNLLLVPATVELSGAEDELLRDDNKVFKLRGAMDEADVKETYDFVLIDCPPSLNLMTLNALAASDSVLVPLQCEFYALEGLSLLLKTIEKVKSTFNPDLEIHGILLTMYDKRNNLSAQVAQDVRGYLGNKVYDTIIPRNVRMSEAPSHGKPSLLYDVGCAGSQAYIQLATELLKREKQAA